MASAYLPRQILQKQDDYSLCVSIFPHSHYHGESTHLANAVLPVLASPTRQILIFLSCTEEPETERNFSEPGTHDQELSRLNTSRVPTDGVPARLEARLLLILLRLILDKPRLRVLVSLLRLEAGRSSVSAWESWTNR